MYVSDKAGNNTYYSASQLSSLGIATSFTITSNAQADTTPPVLTSLTFPGTVDVTTGGQYISFTAGATDQGLGVSSVSVSFSKSWQDSYGNTSSLSAYDSTDSFSDGVSSRQYYINSTSGSGTYNISSVYVSDKAGNNTYYSASQLAGLGIATSFTIVDHSGDKIGTDGQDTLTGSAGADTLLGLRGDDTLYGLGGDDTLDGGAGADRMEGGTGNDVYYVDSALDQVIEAVGEGNDRVYTSVSYSLGAGQSVEELYTTDQSATGAIDLTGNELANTLLGNAGSNVLNGGAGADTLIGLAGDDILIGGDGAANTLIGGRGDDRYFVSAAGDSIVEAAGEGTDTVYTALASFTLSANVENLYFTGTGSFAGTGNAGDNAILGGAGNDTLNGGLGSDTLSAGAGNDILIGGSGSANTLIGGTGDDRYFVSVVGDSIVEYSGEGNDTVSTDLSSYTLAPNVENLIYSGFGAFSGVGNDGANLIVGGVGADTLNGGLGADTLVGGSGNDILIGGSGEANVLQGGSGDDIYFVSVTGDSIVEAAGGGRDTIVTDLSSYTMPAEVESLIYNGTGNFSGTGSNSANVLAGGAGNDGLSGAGGDDVLIGNDGNDVLSGGDGNDQLYGGAGNDRLEGGAGADLFAFTTPNGGIDTIVDFTAGTDRIMLDHGVFAGLATGALSASAFIRGSAAQTADQHIIFDPTNGALYYDADGVGGAAQVQFATVGIVGDTLTANDFVII